MDRGYEDSNPEEGHGFGRALDLGALLSRFDKSGSLVEAATGKEGVSYVLGSASKKAADEDYTATTISWNPSQERLSDAGYTQDRDTPFKVGYGPLVASSCTQIVQAVLWCWDANGYYRSLGVHWQATRKTLKRAYLALNGQNSIYLTYVLTQLLNEEKRRAYNATPLGEPFLDDDYVQAALKVKASQEAQRRTMQGILTTAREVIEEQYNFEELNDDDDDLSDPGEKVQAWIWSYYLWRSMQAGQSVQKLEQWQAALVSSLSRRGHAVDVVVGLMGKTPHHFAIGVVDTHNVIFINDSEIVSSDLADRASAQLLRDLGVALEIE